jgi:ubiquinone/menaquinone biosynthesis C-methylase UbiE
MARKKQRLADLFDQLAPTYDGVGPPFFAHFGRRLVQLARIPHGAWVLDVATGRGAVLFPAAESVGPRGRVIGIDLSAGMVQKTAQDLVQRRDSNAEVRRMDAEHLQFPDEVFDYALCGFSIFFFPQLSRALSELHRVLVSGGWIGLTTFARSFYEQWQWFDELVEGHLPPEPETAQLSKASSPPSVVYDNPKGLASIMKAAGFAQVQVISETTDFIYSSEEQWWSMLWTCGIRRSLERIKRATGLEGLERFKAGVFRQLRDDRQADGIHWFFPVLYTLAVK